MAAAVALRSYGLGWLPSPAGDEGNWTLYAHQLLQGGAPELAPQAQFVSLLHAHLLAMAMRIFGETFLAARVVGAAAMVATVIVVYWLLARRGSRRAAMAASLLIAVHPWTVMYSRTAAVPYAIALATMTVGPLLWVSGVLERRPTLLAAGVLVISLGAHFSPLTIIGAIACIVFAAARRERRWVFTHWAPYAAVAVSEIHILPLLRSAMGVARAGAPAPFFENFVPNVGSYLHMMATGLGGEATLRHFTNSALAPWTALVVALPVVAIIALAGSSETRRQSLLGGFGLLYLLLGLLLAPVILAPRRYWFMPANHYDRYLFAVLPGFAFCLGEVAAAVRGRVGVIVPVFVAWLALGCDGRIAWSYLRARGVDHGEGIFDGGGGYRGWLVTREPPTDDATDHQHRSRARRARRRDDRVCGPRLHSPEVRRRGHAAHRGRCEADADPTPCRRTLLLPDLARRGSLAGRASDRSRAIRASQCQVAREDGSVVSQPTPRRDPEAARRLTVAGDLVRGPTEGAAGRPLPVASGIRDQ